MIDILTDLPETHGGDLPGSDSWWLGGVKEMFLTMGCVS